MTSRIDRRTALAALLLAAFVVLTLLPWRGHDVLKPTFDPSSNSTLQHHTTAWTGAFWWRCAAVLGIGAGICALVPRRRSAQLSAVAALLALASWSTETWHVHHARYVIQPTTIAIANFTAGPHIGLVPDSQLLGAYLAAAVLVGLLLLSLSNLSLADYRSFISRSRFRVIAGSVFLAAIAVLSVLPWYRFNANSVATRHLGGDAWTTGFWPAAILLGLVGAATLLVRWKWALPAGAVAATASIALWAVGAWRTGQPHTEYQVMSITSFVAPPGTLVNAPGALAIKSSVSHRTIATTQTLYSYAALAVLVALLITLTLLIRSRSTRAED